MIGKQFSSGRGSFLSQSAGNACNAFEIMIKVEWENKAGRVLHLSKVNLVSASFSVLNK